MLSTANHSKAQERWALDPSSGISWTPQKRLPHLDNIEMSGRRVSGIVSYTIDSARNLQVERQVFFPQFHPFIKATDPGWFIYRAYLDATYDDDILPRIYFNQKQWVAGAITRVHIDGYIEFSHTVSDGLLLTRRIQYD